MNVLHVTPSFHPARVYGGAIESVYQLCRQLARQGHEIRVLTTNADGRGRVLAVDADRDNAVDGVRVHYASRVAGDSVSPRLLRHLARLVRWADVVHVTAVYSFPVIPALLTCALLDRPVVWSPRGALQRWERTRRPKLKAAWERVCWRLRPRRLVLHFTSTMERVESAGRCPPVEWVVVPNGVEIPVTVNHVPGEGVLRLLFLGRLDPKKGIENLVSACAMLNRAPEVSWSLTVAGSGEDRYVASLRSRLHETGPSRRIALPGHVDGGEKTALLESADIVVVPSHTENFGMVVAEALAHGVPVIASRGTPWQRVEEVGCGLWTTNDPEALALAVRRMTNMPLREMGDRGRRWMEREFSWHARAAEMAQVYEKLLRESDFRRLHVTAVSSD